MQRTPYPPSASPYPPQPGAYPGMPAYPPGTSAGAPSAARISQEVPSNFPDLQSKQMEELQKLIDDEEAFFSYFSALAQVKQIQKDREELAEEVEAQAKNNLSIKPDFDRQKQQLSDVFDQLASVRQLYDQRSQKHQEMCQRFSPEEILINLQVEASKSEEVSEAVADNFLSGKISVEDFIDKFIAAKKLCHIRRAKEEKLRQGGVAGSW